MFTSSHKGIGPATTAGVVAFLAVGQAEGLAIGATMLANLDTFDAFADVPLSHREFDDLIDDDEDECDDPDHGAFLHVCPERVSTRLVIGPNGEPRLVGGDFVSDFLDQIEARYDRERFAR